MHSPSLRRSSPGPGLHAGATAQQIDSLLPDDAQYSCVDANGYTRPSLKRQATVPEPFLSSVLSKKKRDVMMGSDGGQALCSEVMHAAFLEALSKHPPTSTWRSDDAYIDVANDDQADYCRIIQDYILKKTGQSQSFEQISERINLALTSPTVAPLFNTALDSEPHAPANAINPIDEHAYAYDPQVHGKSAMVPFNTGAVLDNPIIKPLDIHSHDESSFSRRRRACNRPILNCRVELPPVDNRSSFVTENLSSSNHESTHCMLTPSTIPVHPSLVRTTSEVELYPSTPVEQCHKNPTVPPEIPRLIDVQRNTVGRWIPTPTEGVLPSFSTFSASSSSDSVSSCERSSESSSSESALSNATERIHARPSLPKRALSWLSLPTQNAPDEHSSPLNHGTSPDTSNEISAGDSAASNSD
ncbi:uncharacterized protein FOMMEDRAFT_153286 [Fomitiporia mediterranea MF3/22]|uniref:uncharacterized protein n=1 Tax=Fomitiporia mediterranea (strain MF3/22) TaxID=694068 RepID=UPI0004407747|nr:uncharacterized protein FOMMEDRAFT_153286 [Fomitiporia mediterranea MF3/22]EJD05939.1 hypothetical protein FOMMEDRAFT_153286 [Fomitiporia mediterranea MF3/22]